MPDILGCRWIICKEELSSKMLDTNHYVYEHQYENLMGERSFVGDFSEKRSRVQRCTLLQRFMDLKSKIKDFSLQKIVNASSCKIQTGFYIWDS